MSLRLGPLYHELYEDRPEPARDREVFRQRIRAYIEHNVSRDKYRSLGAALEVRFGADIPWRGSYPDVGQYVASMKLKYLLSATTVIWHTLYDRHIPSVSQNWRNFIEQVMEEEAMAYTVDEACVIHPLVDSAFADTREYAVKGLGAARYSGAADLFEKSTEAFRADDNRQAVRLLFDSVETVFLLIVQPGNPHKKTLGRNDAKALKPLLPNLDDAEAQDAKAHLIEGFNWWVAAAFVYRHGTGKTEPVAPPRDLAVMLIQQGTAYLRWLIEIDQHATATPTT